MSTPIYELQYKYNGYNDNLYARTVLKYKNSEYYSTDEDKIDGDLTKIKEKYSYFMKVDENTIHLVKPSNMKFLKFVKKTRIKLIAQHIVNLTDLDCDVILDSLELMQVNIDDILNEFLMSDFENSVEAAKVLLSVKCESNQIINIKETPHKEKIFKHMIKFVVESGSEQLVAIRKSLETLWNAFDKDERDRLQKTINKIIVDHLKDLKSSESTSDDETTIDNLVFFRQFLI